jgi:hypothetical protein
MLIAFDLFKVKIIKPKKPYTPRRTRPRKSKFGSHPFDLIYLLVWKLVGSILKPRKPRRTRPKCSSSFSNKAINLRSKGQSFCPLTTPMDMRQCNHTIKTLYDLSGIIIKFLLGKEVRQSEISNFYQRNKPR